MKLFKVKGDFESDVVISVAKLSFSFVVIVTKEKIAEVQYHSDVYRKLTADFQFDIKQLQ
jgi:hypothetical protein